MRQITQLIKKTVIGILPLLVLACGSVGEGLSGDPYVGEEMEDVDTSPTGDASLAPQDGGFPLPVTTAKFEATIDQTRVTAEIEAEEIHVVCSECINANEPVEVLAINQATGEAKQFVPIENTSFDITIPGKIFDTVALYLKPLDADEFGEPLIKMTVNKGFFFDVAILYSPLDEDKYTFTYLAQNADGLSEVRQLNLDQFFN